MTNIFKKKKILIELLSSLKESRQHIVFRTINENPQLFSSLFQFENNDNLLKLSFEREYSIFINDTIEILSQKITDTNLNEVKSKVKLIISELIKFKQLKKTSIIDVVFLSEKINQIESLLEVFNKDQNRTDQINYIRRKERVLFDRKFKLLLEE